MLKQTSRRRDFLQSSAAMLGGAWLGTHANAVLAAAASASEAAAQQRPLANLTPVEGGTLAALADQIFPPDETPGASALGAVHFMDAALAGFVAGAAPMVRQGIEDLNQRAAAHGAAFQELEFEQQTALVSEIESTPFFGLVHFLTLCGLFALPDYGGNADGGAWKLIGFESRHVWQPPYGYYDAHYDEEATHASS